MKKGLVTGATSGIGKEYAKALAREGYNLIISGRRANYINKVKEEIEINYGVEVEVVLVDFSDQSQFDKFLDRIKDEKIDFLVNNAGYGNKKSFPDFSFSEIENMVDVHINAGVKIIKTILPNMEKGTIINVSSLASYTPTSYNALYGGTKAFINIFTESLYLKLKSKGFKVQLLLPSFTYTDFHEKLGIKREKLKSKGIIRWMGAHEVVAYSMKSLNKKACICIPGRINRLLFVLFKFVPRRLYYILAEKNKAL